jgi:hypothetical protein
MGEPNVEQLQASITVSQLEAWQLYFKCEPWGYQLHMGIAAQQQATTVNCTPRGEHAKAVKPKDFMPRPYEPPDFEAAP